MAAHLNDPYEAARALVSQAYRLWLQRETRTDDISAVVIFFDWPQEGKQAAAAAGGEAGAEVSEPQTPSSSPSKQSDGSAPGAPA